MNKQEILKNINSDPHSLNEAIENLYRGKVFIAVSTRIEKYCKTKRGAEGYIKRQQDISYYDDYTQDMVYCGIGLEVVEIKENELIDINSKKLWYNYISNNMCHIISYNNFQYEINQAGRLITDKETLVMVKDLINQLKEKNSIIIIEELKENKNESMESESIEELSILTEDTIHDECSKEVSNNIENENSSNINVTVNFNIDKNGIELSFTDKPNEETRQQLKANGFRWSKYQKIWYAKDTEDIREFLKSIGFLRDDSKTATITEAAKKNVEYPTIDIDDIESYTIDAELSKRENDNAMFRRTDTNHQKELQETLQSANDDIMELLKMDCDKYIEWKAKTYLQSFKKKYYELYKKTLNHKANNPSWMVTGRGGLNVGRYNKKQEQLTNMYKQSSELIEDFNSKIESFKNKVAREKEQKLKKEMDNNLNSIKEIPKFKKSKIKINGDATRENIFNIDNIRWIREVNAYQLEDYSIINNWGAWRVYNADGKEIYSAKSKGTLKDAQKYVLWLLRNRDQKEAI